MSPRTAILVDVGEEAASLVRSQIAALRERLGPDLPLDVRVPRELAGELPHGVRPVLGASGARALAFSAARAGAAGRHLVVLLGRVAPDVAAIEALVAAFDRDPLVGFAQPRFADAAGAGVWSLPDARTGEATLLPVASLRALPEYYFTTERLSACIVIRHEVAAWLSASPDGIEDLPAALLEELCRARRRGYRNLVVNRVLVPSAEPPEALYPVPDLRAREALDARFPDARTAADWFEDGAHQRFERALARTRRSPAASRLPVLFDCRGVQPHHNGTSQAILGLLDGIHSEMPRWEADLLFGRPGAEYHDVARRYPAMRVTTALPDQGYAVAVRLDQPWALSTVAELHRRSTALAFNMLDTIAWDVVYLSTPEVDGTWRFIAEHADGLMYNSAFTRERFGFRFPVRPGTAERVTHHSLHPEEHRDRDAAALPEDEHLLVFGNRYDHKAVASTVDLLNRAFPYRRICGVGGDAAPGRPNVAMLQSGHLTDAEIDRLVATARLVIFPSHYEGFGLPVVKALAYGRTVIVRASPLWREIAGSTRMPGHLVEFVAPHDLVAAVGAALRGPVEGELPFGGDLAGNPPPRWRDCGRRVVELVEAIAGGDARRWAAREHALGRAGA